MGGLDTPGPHPLTLDRLLAQMDQARATQFSAAVGQLVRAIDEWDKEAFPGGRAEMGPPTWAVEASETVVRFFEEWAEQR